MVHTVYWFRKALRVHDNPSLIKSIVSATNLDPIFCLDPWFVKSGKVGVNRMGFLLESLTDLDQKLRKVGSKLIVVHGNPVEELPKYNHDDIG
jgi:cryptochrome